MAKRPLTTEDGEVRELTVDDLNAFKPLREVDPQMLEAVRSARGRPAIDKPKVHIGFRLDADVVEGIRATGRGYNQRVEALLRDALAKGKLRA